MVPPVIGGAGSSYGRGGPAPYPPPVGYNMGGRGPGSAFGTAPVAPNYNALPPFMPPSGGFDIGRGGGSSQRGFSGRLGNGNFGDRKDEIGRRGSGRDRGNSLNAGRGGGKFGGARGDKTSGRGGAGGKSFGGSAGFGSGRGRGRSRGGGGRGGRHGGSSKDDLDNIALPKQDFRNLVPFEKNFYVESPSVRAMSDHELMVYRASRQITVQGHDIPKPIRMFQEANFPGILLFHGIAIIDDFSCLL